VHSAVLAEWSALPQFILNLLHLIRWSIKIAKTNSFSNHLPAAAGVC
jgi:hypothetical protein